MSTCSTTFDFDNLNGIFADFFPQADKHIQLNILLRKWEEKQKRSKKYWNETFNHDGFLTNDTYNNVLYIINDKRTFFKLEYEMQNYIMKNSLISFSNINSSYMYINKTNNKNININEYSKRYKKLILAELNILKPVLIVVLDNSCNLIRDIIRDKRNAEMTKAIQYTPILNLSPLDMSVATKRETLLFFKYLFDQKYGRWWIIFVWIYRNKKNLSRVLFVGRYANA